MNETSRLTGKWSQPGVPHKGWTCIDIEDLGEPSATCEMCETQEIRYVHHMQHPHYPDVLGCGCVCAGHMEEDYEGARQREKVLRNASARRRKWLTRGWRVSRNGNPFLNVDGYNVVVYPAGQGWGFRVSNRVTDKSVVSRRVLASMDAAKLRSFDAMIWMKERGD
ncbi:hypothetical protein [Limobrevibacterium gyesilva]|uniref:HNH endonuclease n=1 Tax=Limobrevibacterium gyesilva TaxID=2991712 RepID=A0AA41YWH7_9PROT|nr:hypothetical protein [Limobrevibacterium gyesilva]MCW3477773.1 hypothetical protein [Limobrevibacterium gyesilva]